MSTAQGERPRHSMIRVTHVDVRIDTAYPPVMRGKPRRDIMMECPACGALWNHSLHKWERMGDQTAEHHLDLT